MLSSSSPPTLSNQEERVLSLAISGLGDKEIAREMELAIDTVRTYWRRIKIKFGGKTRAEVIAEFVRAGSDSMPASPDLFGHLFRRVARDAPWAISIRTSQGSIAYVNQAWVDLTGLGDRYWKSDLRLEEAGLGRQTFLNRVHNENIGEGRLAEFRLTKRGRADRWVHSKLHLIEGNLYIECLTDITKQKAAERQVQAIETERRELLARYQELHQAHETLRSRVNA